MDAAIDIFLNAMAKTSSEGCKIFVKLSQNREAGKKLYELRVRKIILQLSLYYLEKVSINQP